MNDGTITRVIAACLALSAFSIALIAGLAAGNPTPDILLRALIALAACFILGMAIGTVAERIVADHIARDTATAEPDRSPQGPGTTPAAPAANVPS